MAYTNDQIKGYADGMLSSGKSWQDVWNTAQTQGVGLEQLAGAYGQTTDAARAFARQQGVNTGIDPSLLNEINQHYSLSSSGVRTSSPFIKDGVAYQASFSPSGYGQDASPGTTMESIFSYDPIRQGAGRDRFSVYNPDGTFSNDGTFKTDEAMQTFLMALAAAGGMSMLPTAGAGYGAGGAVEPASSLFPSATPGLETLAPVSQISLPSTGAGSLQTISTAGLPSAASTLKTAGAVSSIAKALGVGGDVAGKLLDNVGLKDIVNLLGGGLDTRNQNKYADTMLNYLSGQQAKLDQYYSPDSPEYKQLWQEMSRKDAAAGRNSQYGVRTTDFMGKVAKDRSDAQIRFMNAGGKLMETALGQKASAPTGLMSALDKITRSSGYSLKEVVRYLSDNGVQLTSVDTDYMNGNLTDEQYRAAASAAQLDTDPEANGAITDILGEDFDLNELWEY